MLKLLSLLLLLPLYCIGYQLSICTIFQNDAPYLHEWIEFHKMQGVEHFYLYNNNSSDDYLQILQPYIKKKEITLIDWDFQHSHADINSWNNIQCGAYNHFLSNFGKETQWVAILDTDEFLFCPSGQKLTKFLNRYNEYGGVVANWLMFGTSGIYDIPPKRLMIEFLTRCSYYNYGPNVHVKSIVQPQHVSGCTNPHYVQYKPGKYAVETDYTPIPFAHSSSIKLDQLRINHYWVRTERYLHEYKIPKRNHMCGEKRNDLIRIADELNLYEDTEILQFVPSLQEKMGF